MVLVVDDDKFVLRATGRMLDLLGLKSILVEDGTNALTVFSEHKDEIVCAIIDLSMPEMSGKEVADLICEALIVRTTNNCAAYIAWLFIVSSGARPCRRG